jgi:hypothetical protein
MTHEQDEGGWGGEGLRGGGEEARARHGADEGDGLRSVDRQYTFSGPHAF